MTAADGFSTRGGRQVRVHGPVELLTLERLDQVSVLFDSDPRVASVSLISGAPNAPQPARATAPAGALVCIATDHEGLLGSATDDVEDWSRRASERGLTHYWMSLDTPDVRAHTGWESAEVDRREMDRPTARLFHQQRLERSRSGLTIAVDVTWLGPHETGAQVMTTAAVAALAEHPRVSRVFLRGLQELPTYASHLPDHPKVTLGGEDFADICWYPNQIDFRSNLARAREWGARVITTYLDLIAFTIPRYHASTDAWLAYRSLQRTSALASDGITTISADVARHLLDEVPLLDPARVRAIPLGMDHINDEALPQAVPPDIVHVAAALKDRPFLLVLGNDFVHKNRDFAVAVWQELLRRGISCDLVLAGLHVRSSSSRAEEEERLRAHVDLRGNVHTLDHVSSEARAWLLGHAAAVIYPSSAEGFGFVPYEAAALRTPSTFTGFGPLSEISGLMDIPDSWNVSAYADDLAQLINEPDYAHRRVEQLRRAITDHSWSHFADSLVEFMEEIRDMPVSAAGAVLAEAAADTSALNAVLASKTWRATAPLRSLGRALRRSARE